MAHAPAMLWQWDAEAGAMHPRPAFVSEARRQFVDGGIYRLGEIEQRSDVSHSHQFAWLNEAWKSLPEHYAQEFPSADHLRKWALIKCGFYRETVLDVGSNAVAISVAKTMRSMDEFSAIVVRGPVVVRREAKSQKRHEMDKTEFQASKTAIMELIAGMLGVEASTLSKQSEAA